MVEAAASEPEPLGRIVDDHSCGRRRPGEPVSGHERSDDEVVRLAGKPLVGEEAVEMLYAYVRTPHFRQGFEEARRLSPEELAERRWRDRQERAQRAVAAIAALRPSQ